MAKKLKKGDQVTWRSHGSEATGAVEQEITADTEADGRTVRASEDDPQYLVKSDKSGGEAVHKASALKEERHVSRKSRPAAPVRAPEPGARELRKK